jgi:uncharacterized membrane protein YbaN (DUF454 family)
MEYEYTSSKQVTENDTTLQEMARKSGARIRNIVLTILGFVFLALGIIGIPIPVLPTTPFVLLAATCFSISNKNLYNWLRQNRIFGQYIENYKTKQGIQLSLKISSLIVLWAGLILSMILVHALWAYLLLSVVGIAVSAHLLHMKTKK